MNIFSIILIYQAFAAPLELKNYFKFPESLQAVDTNPAKATTKVPKFTMNKLELLAEKQAAKLFQNKSVFFLNLNGINMSPYSGSISRELVCPNPRAKVVTKTIQGEKQKLVVYEFFTNDYWTIGVCEDKEMKFGGRLVQVYCQKSRAFLEFTLFDEIGAKRLGQVTEIQCIQ